MRMPTRSILFLVLVFFFSAMFWTVQAQSNSGSISGAVADPSGAVVPGATVTIENPVSGYLRTAETDGAEDISSAICPSTRTIFRLRLRASAAWLRMRMCGPLYPLNVNIALKVAGASTTVIGRRFGGSIRE